MSSEAGTLELDEVLDVGLHHCSLVEQRGKMPEVLLDRLRYQDSIELLCLQGVHAARMMKHSCDSHGLTILGDMVM